MADTLQQLIYSGEFDKADELAAKIIAGDSTRDPAGTINALCVMASFAIANGSTAALDLRRKLRAVTEDAPALDRALSCYVDGVFYATDKKSIRIARGHFESALHECPELILAKLGLAALDFAEEKFDKCFHCFKHTLAELGEDAPNIIRVVMAVCCFRMKQYDHARLCIERAIAVDPDDGLALLVQFGIQVHFKEIGPAIATISRLMKVGATVVVTQKYTDLLYFKAVQSGTLSAQRAAILKLINKTRAQSKEANRPVLEAYAVMQHGRLLQAENQQTDALACFDDALRLNPRLKAAAVHRLQVLSKTLRSESELDQEVRATLKQYETDPDLLLMATSLKANQRRHADAIRLGVMLTETVAGEQPDAWSVGAWANRLDRAKYEELSGYARKLAEKAQVESDPALEANAAVLKESVGDLLNVVNRVLKLDLSATAPAQMPVSDATYAYIFNYAYLIEGANAPRAKAIYCELVKRAPFEPAAFVRLAFMAMRGNRPCEATRWARLLSVTHPALDTGLLLTTWVLSQNDKLKEAMTLVHGETKRNKNPSLALATGALYLRDCQNSVNKDLKLERALNAFQFALSADPDNLLAAHGIGCCIALGGHHASAAAVLERVAESDCNFEGVKNGIQENRFNIFVETRAYRAAIAAMENSHARKTKWQRCALATCYSQLGDHEKAISVLDVALAENHNDTSVCYYLVLCLLASVIGAIEMDDTLSSDRGEELLRRLNRARQLAPYAKGVKQQQQADIVTRMLRFVEDYNIAGVVRKRMNDRAKEELHTDTMKRLWRDRHEAMSETQAAAKRMEVEALAAVQARREAYEDLLHARTQELLNHIVVTYDEPAAAREDADTASVDDEAAAAELELIGATADAANEEQAADDDTWIADTDATPSHDADAPRRPREVDESDADGQPARAQPAPTDFAETLVVTEPAPLP